MPQSTSAAYPLPAAASPQALLNSKERQSTWWRHPSLVQTSSTSDVDWSNPRTLAIFGGAKEMKPRIVRPTCILVTSNTYDVDDQDNSFTDE